MSHPRTLLTGTLAVLLLIPLPSYAGSAIADSDSETFVWSHDTARPGKPVRPYESLPPDAVTAALPMSTELTTRRTHGNGSRCAAWRSWNWKSWASCSPPT